ncbi:hypothetical protein Tco_0781920, partial [Tanacetum coccineum]
HGIWFFESEGGGGGRGVNEKQHGLANDTVKDTVVVSSAVDEFDFDNTKGTHEGNVGKILSSFSADPNIGTAIWINITDSPTTDVITRVKFHGVPITAFSEDGLSIIATKLGISLMLDSYTSDMCMQSWHTSSYARAMIDLRADGELKDTIVVAMPKLTGEGFNLYTIRVDYESQPPSNSNPFDALNFVEDDADLGTNEGNLKSAGKGTLNVTHGSSSNTPIIDKINKLECQILDGKLTFLNDNRNPLVSTGNVDSDSEVEVVFDETVILMVYQRVLKVKVTEVMVLIASGSNGGKQNGMMTMAHMMMIQAICDDLDITVRGRKKK